jgi:hypothetical protein
LLFSFVQRHFFTANSRTPKATRSQPVGSRYGKLTTHGFSVPEIGYNMTENTALLAAHIPIRKDCCSHDIRVKFTRLELSFGLNLPIPRNTAKDTLSSPI